MLREIAISVFLFFFRMIFSIFKFLPQQKKTVFVSSFGDNIYHVAQATNKLSDHQLIVLKDKRCRMDFSTIDNVKTLSFQLTHLVDYVRSIYHLATSKVIFIDNYFGFLSVTKFNENVQCIQLWHAAGAIKQFGLMDPSNATRTPRANKRFQQVYDRFSYVVVGSEKMSRIFRQSFNLSESQILRTGIPRTDFFFDKQALQQAQYHIRKLFPMIDGKKVILYAPTFRNNELSNINLQLDITKLRAELGEEYILLLRLHPAIVGTYENIYSDFVIDVSNYENINHLLVLADLLITDYSSVPFEFSLLEKPMIFFTYDLEEYTKKQGFWEEYTTNLPGPIALSTEDIISIIKSNQFDLNLIKEYTKQWNQYSRGNSSENIVHYIYDAQPVKQAKAYN